MEEIQPDYLENYMGLSPQEITRLVLCLLIEEAVKKQLTPFRQISGSKDQVVPPPLPSQLTETPAKRVRLNDLPLSPVKVAF